MANSGSARKPGSGNRRPPGTGNRSASTRRSGAPARPTSTGSPATANGTAGEALTEDPAAASDRTADERARDRLAQPGTRRSPQGGPARSGRNAPSSRAAAKRRQRQQKHRSTAVTTGIFGGLLVTLVVVVIVLVSVLSGTSKPAAGAAVPYQPAPASIVKALETVTPSQFSAAGVSAESGAIASVFTRTPKQPAVTDPGKPLLVYIGAEFCPYCAASRWPLVIALSRFGKFTGLGIVASSPSDYAASTRTLSLAKASYTSQYLAFQFAETTTNICSGALVSGVCPGYTKLQNPTAANANLLVKYDNGTYFPQDVSQSASSGWIPFLDWAGKYVSSGAMYSPTDINPGPSAGPWPNPFSWAQIVATLTIPKQGAGQVILATANVYTGAICAMTNNNPGSVCKTPVVQSAEKALSTLAPSRT